MINNIDKDSEFKFSQGKNNTINYLDISGNKIANSIELNIYRKHTCIDITIHFTSNHLLGQKLEAFIFCINRMTTMPVKEQAKKTGMAQDNYNGPKQWSPRTYNPQTEK